VLVGQPGVGKTSIFRALVNQPIPSPLSATTRADFAPLTVSYENREIELQLWDTAGAEEYRAVAPFYLRAASVALIVFAVTDKHSFQCTDEWKLLLERSASSLVPIILVGNKSDLETNREVDPDAGMTKAREFDAEYLETSVVSRVGLNDLLKTIASHVHDQQQAPITEIDTAPFGGSDRSCCG
jgi:small GTP-binding protein